MCHLAYNNCQMAATHMQVTRSEPILNTQQLLGIKAVNGRAYSTGGIRPFVLLAGAIQ